MCADSSLPPSKLSQHTVQEALRNNAPLQLPGQTKPPQPEAKAGWKRIEKQQDDKQAVCINIVIYFFNSPFFSSEMSFFSFKLLKQWA